MKRPRKEEKDDKAKTFPFLSLKPLVCPEDPDLTLHLKATKIVEGTPQYEFDMRHTYERHHMGGCVLRIGLPEDPCIIKQGHIGYMVKPADRGHRYAMKACKMLFPIAKQHDLKVLQIVTAADNLASAKTCELLGAVLKDEYDAPYNGATQARKRFEIELRDEKEEKRDEEENPFITEEVESEEEEEASFEKKVKLKSEKKKPRTK